MKMSITGKHYLEVTIHRKWCKVDICKITDGFASLNPSYNKEARPPEALLGAVTPKADLPQARLSGSTQ